MTFVELIHQATEKATARQVEARTTYVSAAACRELALAKTALEDAQMRYTRGVALIQDNFHPADLEK